MPSERARGVERAEARAAWALCAPALLAILGIALFPLAWTAWESLHLHDLRMPWLGRPFVGLANYLEAHKREGETDEEAYQRIAPDVPLQRAGQPSEIGDAVVYLASDQSSYVNGIVFPVHGGMVAGL